MKRGSEKRYLVALDDANGDGGKDIFVVGSVFSPRIADGNLFPRTGRQRLTHENLVKFFAEGGRSWITAGIPRNKLGSKRKKDYVHPFVLVAPKIISRFLHGFFYVIT